MTYITLLNDKLNKYHLLNHDFYKAWNAGKLSSSTLRTYAKEYYHHVAAFPRYLSAIHSQCTDLQTRQVLLGNLMEEEHGEDNHPELWQRFAEGIGVNRSEMRTGPQLKETKNLVDGYFELVKSDFATGLGALYAYERQTPEVSESKIEGLQQFYEVSDDRTLQFFIVHMKADEWHSAECIKLIENLDATSQVKVAQGAEQGAKLLWFFLDGMMYQHAH